ncbi:MAG: hypothetical protein [Caudoviricetes sp.]|nr:MAG: hypothetical protein [Caudoviricetes sp.]
MRWLYIDKQRKQKFDSISAGHEAALIAMGVISPSEHKANEGPSCPSVFMSVVDKYRELKFLRRQTDEGLLLYPRDMLTWQDLDAFQRVSGQRLTMLESEIIMGIEGIFEGRDDG